MLKFIIALVLISSTSFALDVADPHNDLNFLNGTLSFAQAFSCPDSSYVYGATGVCSVNCSAHNCMSQCKKIATKSTMFADTCAADHVALYGDQGLEFNITAQDYAAGHNTAVMAFLKQSAQFFSSTPTKVTISFNFPKMLTFVHDGKIDKVFGNMIMVDYQFQPGTMTMSAELMVDPFAKGLDQILRFRAGSDVLYQRKGFFDDMP